MKRILVLLLVLALCLCGCKKEKLPTDIPGGEEAPEGVEWQTWEAYIPCTLNMGETSVDVLIGLDEIHLAVYYDKPEQELLGSITILTPLSDVAYSTQRLKVQDLNGDGYDDISIPDMLPNGDRIVDSWLWDTTEGAYLYAPEYSQFQSDVAADISWRDGKNLVSGVRDIPEGSENLLFWVDGQTIYIYLDQREETLLTTVQIPQQLSAQAWEEVNARSFWDCWDLNGDSWGDLQLVYRWEETEGGLVAYAYYWIWDVDSGSYVLDADRSGKPVM